MKNLLSENMLRFGTKNLTESAKRKLVFESIMQTIDEHGLHGAVRRSLLTEGDKIIGQYNYGDLANRKPYYAMMKAGKLPNIFLTYKYDASWFDSHTGVSIADMARPNYPYGDQLLRQIRSGKVGWQPSTGITVFLAKVGAQEMMQAAGTSSSDRKVDDYLNQQGSGSPQ